MCRDVARPSGSNPLNDVRRGRPHDHRRVEAFSTSVMPKMMSLLGEHVLGDDRDQPRSRRSVGVEKTPEVPSRGRSPPSSSAALGVAGSDVGRQGDQDRRRSNCRVGWSRYRHPRPRRYGLRQGHRWQVDDLHRRAGKRSGTRPGEPERREHLRRPSSGLRHRRPPIAGTRNGTASRTDPGQHLVDHDGQVADAEREPATASACCGERGRPHSGEGAGRSAHRRRPAVARRGLRARGLAGVVDQLHEVVHCVLQRVGERPAPVQAMSNAVP